MKTFSATDRSGKSVGSWKMIAIPASRAAAGPVEDERAAVGVDERAAVGRVDAAEDLDERRFAGAVLADERVHLAAVEVDRDVLERLYGAERLAGVVHPEDRPPSRSPPTT